LNTIGYSLQKPPKKLVKGPMALLPRLPVGLSNLIQIFEMASGKILPITISEFAEIFKPPNLYLVSK
jgi:hypothetical protein